MSNNTKQISKIRFLYLSKQESQKKTPLFNTLNSILNKSKIQNVKKISQLSAIPETIVSPQAIFYSSKTSLALAKSGVVNYGGRILQDIVDYITILRENKCSSIRFLSYFAVLKKI